MMPYRCQANKSCWRPFPTCYSSHLALKGQALELVVDIGIVDIVQTLLVAKIALASTLLPLLLHPTPQCVDTSDNEDDLTLS